MKFVQFIISLLLIAILIWLNRTFVTDEITTIGGLSILGWASVLIAVAGFGLFAILSDSARSVGFFRGKNSYLRSEPPIRTLTDDEIAELGIRKYRGPAFPHPVIFTERCIGCQACVDACPHDVLAIVNGVAASIAPDQCMEDTACQAECPVNPKACIVINTAKKIRSRPSPVRDGSSYQTNVKGCYIIGDVSGVPLIKNAVKEGAEVISYIASDLEAAPPEPKAELDVAIIGIGPGGASAAASAHDAGLRYVGIEQVKILTTIEVYPKGKYIFFKPDTNDWSGGLKAVGLGLSKAKYDGGASVKVDNSSIIDEVGLELESIVKEQAALVFDDLIGEIPRSLHAEYAPLLAARAEAEIKTRIGDFLRKKGPGNWPDVFQRHFRPDSEIILAGIRAATADQYRAKIPGDLRENILAVWLGGLTEKGVKINEYESCKEVKPATDGDYFEIRTSRGSENSPQTYRSRRVVVAIGLRGAPNRLRLKNEDIKLNINGHDEPKVLY
ncbi:MAG: 4Fe-4S binding protein, partial [Pyrinomonadaceae bacterium]